MGASWVHDEILEHHPEADLSVYAVWVPQFGARRGDVDTSLFEDKRVRVYWDPTGAVANRVVGNAGAYDVYALYDAGAELGRQSTTAAGGPVIADAGRLKASVEGLLS